MASCRGHSVTESLGINDYEVTAEQEGGSRLICMDTESVSQR